ncbi:uncharacterized protein [Prorops nasuta]|uniref:uncharacterized protein n=1 Tax=Prorops nasuta TaxID=863751 RepID=UPI0034CF7F5C
MREKVKSPRDSGMKMTLNYPVGPVKFLILVSLDEDQFYSKRSQVRVSAVREEKNIMQFLAYCFFFIILSTVAVNSVDYDDPWIWDEIKDSTTREDSLLKATSTSSILISTKMTDKTTVESTTKRITTPTLNPTSTPTTTTSLPKLCADCALTSEYNPVCGNDYITYNNPSILECAKKCGTDVDLLFYGGCRPL